MTDPLVHCAACAREWHSATMADGLRLVPGCPRCGGDLVFADATAPAVVDRGQAPAAEPAAPQEAGLAPHLVMGVPRR